MNEKLNVFDLSENHKTLLSKFLTFFKTKQEKFVREIGLTIEEFKDHNVKEMMFSKQEVFDFMDTLKINMSENMENEMTIFVQLLLHEADKLNVTLKVETAQVQNLQNVNEMNEFVKSVLNSNLLSDFGKPTTISKLGSISKTQNLINDFEQMKHDYDMLLQNFNILKNQNELLIKENKNLESNSNNYSFEVNTLRDQIIKLSVNDLSNNKNLEIMNQIQIDLESTKKKLDEQVSLYQNLLKDYDVKLSESIQFQQLKKFLQDKNSMIIELKKKLANFEEK